MLEPSSVTRLCYLSIVQVQDKTHLLLKNSIKGVVVNVSLNKLLDN